MVSTVSRKKKKIDRSVRVHILIIMLRITVQSRFNEIRMPNTVVFSYILFQF